MDTPSYRAPQDSPATTGRLLVVTRPEAPLDAVVDGMADTVGLRCTAAADARRDGVTAAAVLDDDPRGLVFERLGVAVVDADPDQVQRLTSMSSDTDSWVVAIEPERTVWASVDDTADDTPSDTAGGGRLEAGPVDEGPASLAGATWVDTAEATWGLQAASVTVSGLTGRGTRVAVLDTGADRDHPALVDAVVAATSFVPGEQVDDGNGHGTHCAGTVAGRATDPRIGVAPDAELLIGRVLSDAGSGTDATVLDGIEWALEEGARIVSMSLGSMWRGPEPWSVVFETAARRALELGTLLVAAAGNDSRRTRQQVAPVGSPANAPSVVAVGAVGPTEMVADFSNGSVLPHAQVDVVGPGVGVLSAWPGGGVRALSGTSMATPHVAGLLALAAQSRDQGSPRGLLADTLLAARRLPLPSTDVGAGLGVAVDTVLQRPVGTG